MKQSKEIVNGRIPLGEISGDLKEFDKSLEASNAKVISFGSFQLPNEMIEVLSKAVKEYKENEEINKESH